MCDVFGESTNFINDNLDEGKEKRYYNPNYDKEVYDATKFSRVGHRTAVASDC